MLILLAPSPSRAQQTGDARQVRMTADIAKNAFGHPKAIGFCRDAQPLLDKAGVKPTRAFSDGSRAGETKAQPRERAVLHIRNGLLRSWVARLGARDSRLAQSDRYGTNPLPAGCSSTAQPQL